jgi:MGT family glycosyltransferase
MRIGVTVSPATGHLNAMTALARRLASRGHEVVCIGVPDAAPGVASAGLRFEEICGSHFPPGWYADMSEQLSRLSGMDALAFTMKWIDEGCRAELADTPLLLERMKFDGLVVDLVNAGVGAVAMGAGLPFVHVSCTPFADFSGITPMYLFPWPHKDSILARARNQMGVVGYQQVIRRVRATLEDYVESKGVKVDKSDPYSIVSKLGYLTQVPAAFDFPGDHLPPHFHRTGPFHDGLGRSPVEFPWERLTGAPLIYASMGTMQNGLADVFRTILKALERPGYQVVLSVGPTIPPESLETQRPDTIVVQSAPQLELLKLATLCVTHAGLNTTLESLAQGVPLVAIPITNDQPGVAARILASGTGLFVPLSDLTAERLTGLVDEVLAQPSFKQRALRMKAEIEKVDGLGMAAELIERAFSGAMHAAQPKVHGTLNLAPANLTPAQSHSNPQPAAALA